MPGFGFGGGSSSGGGGSGHTIKDEGTPLTARTGLNFTGAGVTVTDDAINNETDVAISGAAVGYGSPAASAVGDTSADGVSANVARSDHRHPREAFAGTGAAATVAHSDHTHSTLEGHSIEDEGTPLTQRAAMNFTGNAVAASDTGGKTTVSIKAYTNVQGAGAGVPQQGTLNFKTGFTVVNNGGASTSDVDPDFGATPTASAVGDAQAAGTATTLSRNDHKHAREAFAAPAASAVGDVQATGSATTINHSDHVHAREAFAAPSASAVGDAQTTGSATTINHSDHKHAREAFAAPAAEAVGGAAVTGSATTIPHSDHVHAITDIISKGGSVLDPAGARNITVWRAPYACTVTNVRAFRKSGTGATINARRNATSNHLSSALSVSSADTWTDGGSVQNTAYAIGDSLEIMVVSITGVVTELDIQVDFTRP